MYIRAVAIRRRYHYVDYKNTLISMECVDASHLATPIVRACSYPYLRLFFCHV